MMLNTKSKTLIAMTVASVFWLNSLPSLAKPLDDGSQAVVTARTTIPELEQRLAPFLQSPDDVTLYHAKKAQMWLTYASHQKAEGGWTTAENQARAEAQKLIEQLEQKQTISTTTPVFSSSKVMRRDLWATLELLKQHEGFQCAPTEIAQAEVMLVWAAAEHCELGWQHSRELFAAAEQLVDSAHFKVLNCQGKTSPPLQKISYPSFEELNGTQSGCHGVVGSWPILPAPQPSVPVVMTEPTPVVPTVIPNIVHFALDKSDLSLASQQTLNSIAQTLQDNPNYSVTLYGYTDTRASVAYNLGLSKRRATAVMSYLSDHGINPNRLSSVAVGKRQSIADSNKILGHALSRRVELVYVSADGQEIATVAQRDDLQLER